MDFDSQHVAAHSQAARRHDDLAALDGDADGAARQRTKGDRAGRHVLAVQFVAVEIKNRPVVDQRIEH